MIIISDSTVLINFAYLNLFDKLYEFFGTIIVPKKVYKEVYVDGGAKPGSKEVLDAKSSGWIIVEEINDTHFYDKLTMLHDGEREALTLAHQYGESFVLTDDNAARYACRRFLPLATCYTTFEVGEVMYQRGLVRMSYIEMAINLRQLKKKNSRLR